MTAMVTASSGVRRRKQLLGSPIPESGSSSSWIKSSFTSLLWPPTVTQGHKPALTSPILDHYLVFQEAVLSLHKVTPTFPTDTSQVTCDFLSHLGSKYALSQLAFRRRSSPRASWKTNKQNGGFKAAFESQVQELNQHGERGQDSFSRKGGKTWNNHKEPTSQEDTAQDFLKHGGHH